MIKVKLVDLFNVRFEKMEVKINDELEGLKAQGCTVKDMKVIGDSLNKCAVFIIYEE